MSDITRRFCWVAVFANAIALPEAVVVAYIRALLQVTADRVDLGRCMMVEVG